MSKDIEEAIAHRALERIWELMDDYLRHLFVSAISIDLPDGYDIEVWQGDDRDATVTIRWDEGVVEYEMGSAPNYRWRLYWHWLSSYGKGNRTFAKYEESNRFATLGEAIAATAHIHHIDTFA